MTIVVIRKNHGQMLIKSAQHSLWWPYDILLPVMKWLQWIQRGCFTFSYMMPLLQHGYWDKVNYLIINRSVCWGCIIASRDFALSSQGRRWRSWKEVFCIIFAFIDSLDGLTWWNQLTSNNYVLRTHANKPLLGVSARPLMREVKKVKSDDAFLKLFWKWL